MNSLPQTLFHGTGIYCLARIIATNTMREGAHWGKPGEPHGPRFTERFGTASEFILYSMYWAEGGVIAVDTSTLAQRHRIVRYADSYYSGEQMADEHEYVAETPLIDPLAPHLVSIICDPAIIEAASLPENMQIAMDEGGWPFSCDQAGVNECLTALGAVANHPLLNAWLPEGEAPPFHGNWGQPRANLLASCNPKV